MRCGAGVDRVASNLALNTYTGAAHAKVWVFGSRATGRTRRFSDLDLLVETLSPLDWAQQAALQEAFEASDLPFRVDVVERHAVAEGMRARVEAEMLAL